MVSPRTAALLAPLSPSRREKLRRFAVKDAASRTVRGSVTYLIMLICLGICTTTFSDHPRLMWTMTAFIFTAVTGRVIAYRYFDQIYRLSPSLWRGISTTFLTTIAVCCGNLNALFIVLYGYECWTFVLLMIWITGIAAGSLTILMGDLRMLRFFSINMLGPGLAAGLVVGGEKGYCFAFVMLMFIGYGFIQGTYTHDMYWRQMIGREMEAERNEELELARKTAEEASRVKSQFLAHMSHEIRTPMHGVIGIADLLRHTELTTQQQQLLSVLSSSAEGLLVVINDILDLSKVEAGKLTLESIPVNIQSLTAEVHTMLNARAEAKGLNLTLAVDDSLAGSFLCDQVRLRQVLINLVGNAIKFTEKGSVGLRVSLGEELGPEKVRIRFSVVDTGIGIPLDKQGIIFDAFAQADGTTTRRFGGTGLGLAICSKIVQIMGSRLELISEPGAGSTFSFTCDLERCPEAISAVAIPRQASSTVEPLRILVAEDNPVNQIIVNRALSAEGHTVFVAKNGREAVDAALSTNFDVILMDNQMPELSGIEATRLIKAYRPHVPIICLSANAMDGDREHFLSSGMDGYVSKPFRLDELLSAIERCRHPLAV